MQTGVAQKLRLNLARRKCISLRLTTEANLGEDLAALVGINPKRRFTTFYEEYTRSGIAQSMTLRFVRYIREENQYAIRVVYEAGEPKELVPSLMPKGQGLTASEAFAKLCDLEGPFLFRCDCSFSYRRGDKEVDFWLPIVMDQEIFDEIRGVRLVKLQQDKVLWEASLDLVEIDLMVHRIRFAHEGKFSLDLPQKLLKQAKAISRKV